MTINRDILINLYNRIPDTHQIIRDALLKAARYTISNPALSLKKCNIALSIILRDLYEKELNKDVTNDSLRAILSNERFTNTVEPKRIILLMNLVFKMSEAPAANVDFKTAKIAIEYLIDIIDWYVKELVDREKHTRSSINALPIIPAYIADPHATI